MKSFDGYLKRKFGDDYVLLAGGDTKSLSNLIGSIQYDSTNKKIQYKSGSATSWSDLVTFGSNAFNSTEYLPLTGGTLSGDLTIKAGLNLMTKSSSSLEKPNQDLTIRALGYKNSGDTVISWKVYSYQGINENPGGVGYMPIVFGSSYPNGLVFTGSNSYSGTTYSNYWGINTSDPQYLLHVNGTFGAGATTVSSLTTTGDVTISGNLIKKIAGYTRGTSPTSRKCSAYKYLDQNETYVGWMQYVAETDGRTSLGFYLVTPTSASNSADKWSGFNIFKPSDKTYGVYTMSFNVDSGQLSIPASEGTAPFSISSTTRVPNLNADTVDGKHASDFALSGDLSSYLPLIGGSLTGTLRIDYSDADFTKGDNGVSETKYPGFFIRDKNGKQTGRIFTAISPNGKLATYLYSNNYNTAGNSVGEMYLGQEISKDGTKTWVLTDAASFRAALGLSTNYVTLETAQTITGTKTFSGNGSVIIYRSGNTIPYIWLKNGNGVVGGIGNNPTADNGLIRITANGASAYTIWDDQNAVSRFINKLGNGTADFTDGTHIVTSYADNDGFVGHNSNIYRRPASAMWGYIISKICYNMASGDDYETLSGYSRSRGMFVACNFSSLTSGVTLTGLGAYDTLVSFGYSNRTIQFKGAAYSDALKYRHVQGNSTDGYSLSAWKTIAFTDSNVASATKLQTARTLWGQSFNGTADVSGSLSSVGNISPSSIGSGNIGSRNNYFSSFYGKELGIVDSTTNEDMAFVWRTVGGARVFAMYAYETKYNPIIIGQSGALSGGGIYIDAANNRIGIGTYSPSSKLHVSGGVLFQHDNYTGVLTLKRNKSGAYGVCMTFANNDGNFGDFGYDGGGFFNLRNSSGTSLISAVSATGNVGIGTTSPEYKLHVSGGVLGVLGTEMRWLISGTNKCINAYTGSNTVAAQIQYNGANMIQLGNNSGVAKVMINYGAANNSTNALQMYGYTTSMYQGRSTLVIHINSSGNVGIGTDSPEYKLHISGTCGATNYYTTSDQSKKQNITTFSEHIRKFQLKDTQEYAYGVIAQEVEEIFRDGEEGNMTVNYNSVLSYYVGQLENKVKELEEKIKLLETK